MNEKREHEVEEGLMYSVAVKMSQMYDIKDENSTRTTKSATAENDLKPIKDSVLTIL